MYLLEVLLKNDDGMIFMFELLAIKISISLEDCVEKSLTVPFADISELNFEILQQFISKKLKNMELAFFNSVDIPFSCVGRDGNAWTND